MMYLKDKALKLFRDKEQKYKPYNLYLCSNKIGGWKYKEVSGESVNVLGTYNDTAYVKVKGESEQTITTQGKNLFDIDKFISLSGNSTYYSKDIDGNLIQKAPDYRQNGSFPIYNTLPKGTYCVTWNTSNFRIYINGSFQIDAKTFTLADTSTVAFKSWAAAENNLGKIQIELGTSATSYETFVPNSPSNLYRQVINSVSDFDLITTDGTQTQTIHFSGTYRGLDNGVCDNIIIDNVAKTAIYQPYIKNATLSSGSSWNLADAKINSAFRCTAIKQSTLSGTTLESAEVITSSFDVQYELATPPEPTELGYEAVKTYFANTEFSTNATIKPTLEVKLRINE